MPVLKGNSFFKETIASDQDVPKPLNIVKANGTARDLPVNGIAPLTARNLTGLNCVAEEVETAEWKQMVEGIEVSLNRMNGINTVAGAVNTSTAGGAAESSGDHSNGATGSANITVPAKIDGIAEVVTKLSYLIVESEARRSRDVKAVLEYHQSEISILKEKLERREKEYRAIRRQLAECLDKKMDLEIELHNCQCRETTSVNDNTSDY